MSLVIGERPPDDPLAVHLVLEECADIIPASVVADEAVCPRVRPEGLPASGEYLR